MVALTTNKSVEEAAIQWVMQLERVAGREPRDVRYARSAADIESPPRLIEVKAFGTTNRGYDLWLEVSQVEEARRNKAFHLYIVENVRQGDPENFTLKVIAGEQLLKLLLRAKERR